MVCYALPGLRWLAGGSAEIGNSYWNTLLGFKVSKLDVLTVRRGHQVVLVEEG